jgi:mono/diheme cytochrome c family protein
MRKSLILLTAILVVGVGVVVLTQPKFPVPESIPGITAADPAPNGCVDCHTSDKAGEKLAKITVLLDEWNKNGAPAQVKAAAQLALKSVGGDPTKITGKHPVAGAPYKGQNIPGEPGKVCLLCHKAGAVGVSNAPPLDALLYLLKYGDFDGKDKFVTPAKKNEFVTKFGGWCTACHALDGWKDRDGALTGKLLLKQGKEK